MLSLLKKWFIWAVGALLIAGGAFFMYPVPENGGRGGESIEIPPQDL